MASETNQYTNGQGRSLVKILLIEVESSLIQACVHAECGMGLEFVTLAKRDITHGSVASHICATATRQAVDAIVVVGRLPGCAIPDGVTLIREIRKHGFRGHLIGCSGNQRLRQPMLAAGASSFCLYGLQSMAEFLKELRSIKEPTQVPMF
jgi:hypothetical protein